VRRRRGRRGRRHRLARELHGRLGRFVEPFAKVGRQLSSATAAYNEAVGSFDSRVMPQVRRIEQAGAASEREVRAPDAVEITARAIASQPQSEAPERPRMRSVPPQQEHSVPVERLPAGA